MSSPLYDGAFLEKKGATVRYRLTIIHPDVSDFGTDRFFVWKLLSDWVSPTDDADDATMARKYIRKVELSPLENGTVDEKGKGFFTVKRKGKKNPTVVYTIEVSDPAILKGISVGDSDEVYQYVELDNVIPDEEPVSAAAPAGTRRFELVEGTSSKFWQGHVEGSKLHVQWGRIGTEGQSQVKPFPAGKAQQEFDKLVAEKLKKGYSEVGGVAAPAAKSAPAAKPTAASKNAKPAKAEAAPAASKTFDDLREATFALVEKRTSWLDYMVGFMVGPWSSASDVQMTGWIERLSDPAQGYRSLAAGRVAVERARAGNVASARRFLELAEQLSAPAREEYSARRALEGLIPAWWRLGEKAKADHAFAQLEKEPSDGLWKVHLLAGLAGLGGRADLVLEMAPKMLRSADQEKPLIPAVVALWADGADEAVDAVLKRWDKVQTYPNYDLSRALLGDAIRRGRPGDYLELALRYPKVLSRGTEAELALVEAEKRDPADAVRVARLVLGDSFYEDASLRAVALLATHAPKDAAAWEKKKAALLADKKSFRRFPYSAALGHEDEAATGIKLIAKTDDRYATSNLFSLARITTRKDTAVAALKAYVQHSLVDLSGRSLVPLVDLGERAFVDEHLEKELARVEKLVPKERDLRCRDLARAAAQVGRLDLAVKAIALPTKSVRRYSAKETLRGCAAVGDWTGALTALELDPDDDSNGRVSAAVQAGLREASEAWVEGPRALPLRSRP